MVAEIQAAPTNHELSDQLFRGANIGFFPTVDPARGVMKEPAPQQRVIASTTSVVDEDEDTVLLGNFSRHISAFRGHGQDLASSSETTYVTKARVILWLPHQHRLWREPVLHDEAGQAKFADEFLGSFEGEPIENGYPHPAETIAAEALLGNREEAARWISSLYAVHYREGATTAANILRILGRLPRPLALPWGWRLAFAGLFNDDIEVRDAAVRAFELWGGQTSLMVLRAYLSEERVPWLARYIRQVIIDLNKALE